MVSSVFNSSAALSALSTLRSTNRDLDKVSNQLSTGMRVSSAKDNAAIFSITRGMNSDLAGYQALTSSLSLGEATTAIAANGASSISSLLSDIRDKVIESNASGADRATIGNEITSLTDQISDIVNSAQLNGLNLIDGSQTSYDVLSSVANNGGAVTTGQISLDTSTTNLSATTGLVLDNFDGGGGSAATVTGATAGTDESATPSGFDNTGFQVLQSTATLTVSMARLTTGSGGGAATQSEATAGELTDTSAFLAGDTVAVTVGGVRGTYTVRENDQLADIASGIRSSLIDAGIDTGDFTVATNFDDLEITNNTGVEVRVEVDIQRGAGGLSALAGMSVASAGDAATALGTIDSLITQAAAAEAAIGTTQRRLEIQNEFMSDMSDTIRSGISSLVDADLSETAAQAAALQVQQELAMQSLSIANQSQRNILALFR